MPKINWIFILILSVFFNCQNQVAKQKPDTTIEGWNILTNKDSIAVEVISLDGDQGINHLQVFERTYLTARLYHSVASAYFAYRTMARGDEYRTDFVRATFQQGMEKLPEIIKEILDYPHPGPVGQYSWREDAFRAMRYYLEFHNLMEKGKFGYTPDTFKRFPYSGVAERQKEKLTREYNSLLEKNNSVY
jgi:hypothetical protein